MQPSQCPQYTNLHESPEEDIQNLLSQVDTQCLRKHIIESVDQGQLEGLITNFGSENFRIVKQQSNNSTPFYYLVFDHLTLNEMVYMPLTKKQYGDLLNAEESFVASIDPEGLPEKVISLRNYATLPYEDQLAEILANPHMYQQIDEGLLINKFPFLPEEFWLSPQEVLEIEEAFSEEDQPPISNATDPHISLSHLIENSPNQHSYILDLFKTRLIEYRNKDE